MIALFGAYLGIVPGLLAQDTPVLIRRSPIPEPSTLDQLRAIHRSMPKPEGTPARDTQGLACSLPSVRVSGSFSVLRDPLDSLKIAVPGDWQQIGLETSADGHFGFPYARYENAADARFTVYRVATGATGPSWDADTPGVRLPTEDCEVSNERSGIIWAFRSRSSGGVKRYVANADAVSSDGRRYKFMIGAPTIAARDSLAAFISLAVTPGQHK